MSTSNIFTPFSMPIYHAKNASAEINAPGIRDKIGELFEAQSHLRRHPLELGAADSTSKTTWALGELLYSDAIAPLASLVLAHARIYWDDILGYEQGAPLKIVRDYIQKQKTPD